jgi:RNA polymerase sigma factor (sigma-70 family)
MDDHSDIGASGVADERFYRRIRRIAAASLAASNPSADILDDVVQIVALKLWESPCDDDVSDAYIARLLKWRYADLMRIERREESLEAFLEAHPQLPIFETPTPEELYLVEEEVEEALARLTLEERMVVQGMRWGYSAQEIASELNMSVSWVYKVWNAVMHKLQSDE